MQPLTEQAQYSSQQHPLAIHIGPIIKEKLGRDLPRPVLRTLERIIHQREINDILYRYGHLEGKAFLAALMQEFQVQVDWVHAERLPEQGRALFVCNHPLGGMDGIALSHLLCEQYGDVRYLVNDMLYKLQPLQSVFLPLNKYGAQGKESVELLQEALRSDLPIGSFPAGFCSRIYDGKIQDQEWRKTFITQAIQYERDIVPLHFVGQNSRHFYWVWRLKNLLRMGFDPGSALLPDELFRAKGKHFQIIVGEAIRWQSLKDDKRPPRVLAAEIRARSYQLRTQYDHELSATR